MFTIIQTDDGWEVRAGDTVLTVADSYEAAVAALSGAVAELADLAADSTEGDGLLPEVWSDGGVGVGFAVTTDDGRDMTGAEFVWRSPDDSLLPLMLQTETDVSHMGAELAGFIQSISFDGKAVHAEGRFYDTDTGRAARDLLLDGRRFGVSMDGGPRTEAEFTCTEEDEIGFCVDGVWIFSVYEMIGLTMTPFPAFADAAIMLADAAAEQPEPEAVTASVTVPQVPDRAWFSMPEPDAGDDLLVEQPDGTLAVPLTITDDGRVFGHVARWGQCHIGHGDACISPPSSPTDYSHFHVGLVETTDGEIPVGTLTVSTDHAPLSHSAGPARDHYAHSGYGWANVRVSDGKFGPWACGALRPDVKPDDVAVLRSLALSGDWRTIDGALDLVGVLSVNVPGFPIARAALAASGLDVPAAPKVAARLAGATQSTPLALVASGVVTRCSTCGGHGASTVVASNASHDTRLDRIESMLGTLLRRTSHLRSGAAETLAASITAE